jgi:hypothetical protein
LSATVTITRPPPHSARPPPSESGDGPPDNKLHRMRPGGRIGEIADSEIAAELRGGEGCGHDGTSKVSGRWALTAPWPGTW